MNVINLQVQIESDNLYLQSFTENHISETYVSWLNNPEVVRYSELRHQAHTIETSRNYLKTFINTPHVFLAILEKKNKLHIGNINAYIDIQNSIADIGIILGEVSIWGKGYGLEAWKSLCEFLFKQRKIRKITGGTLSVNLPMLKIFKKMKMNEDGRRKQHYLFDGNPVDVVHYCLFHDKEE